MMDTQRNTTRVPFSSTEPLSILQIIALVFKLATVLSSTLCSAAAGSKKALNPLYIICSEVNGGQSFWKKRKSIQIKLKLMLSGDINTECYGQHVCHTKVCNMLIILLSQGLKSESWLIELGTLYKAAEITILVCCISIRSSYLTLCPHSLYLIILLFCCQSKPSNLYHM